MCAVTNPKHASDLTLRKLVGLKCLSHSFCTGLSESSERRAANNESSNALGPSKSSLVPRIVGSNPNGPTAMCEQFLRLVYFKENESRSFARARRHRVPRKLPPAHQAQGSAAYPEHSTLSPTPPWALNYAGLYPLGNLANPKNPGPKSELFGQKAVKTRETQAMIMITAGRDNSLLKN